MSAPVGLTPSGASGTFALMEITDKHIKIARACAGKYARQREGIDAEAMEGVALEALTTAARDFREGGSFERFLIQRVWYRLLDESRRSSGLSRAHFAAYKQNGEYTTRVGGGKTFTVGGVFVESLDAVTESEHALAETVADKKNAVEDCPALLDHRAILARLPARLRFVLLCQIEEVPQEDIAVLMHLSAARISQLQKQAREVYQSLAA